MLQEKLTRKEIELAIEGKKGFFSYGDGETLRSIRTDTRRACFASA